MSRKSIGTAAERQLVGMFWQAGWAAVRVAGSGSSQHPSPDVVAGDGTRKLAIECKVTEAKAKYFPIDEIAQLETFARTFGAEPWIGIKFKTLTWYFLAVEDLDRTGTQFSASLLAAKRKGLLFEELIGIGR
ncbi:Holliday junction resolvase [Candidatus Woesearchaeota archaeon]|nr:Holliday junction resolvase [Candidatus Woesearchaeota archaeon]